MSLFILSNQNVQIYEETKRLAPIPDQKSIKHKFEPQANKNKDKDGTSKNKIKVNIIDMDTLDAAKLFVKPLVMNFADDKNPGGCVEFGACSQEENLFRRTNLCHTLTYKNMYPIRFDEAIYSPNVTVFRKNESAIYAIMKDDERFLVDIISCPGLKYPRLKAGHISKKDSDILANKIRLIFQLCRTYNHKVLIAGALGCGAWCNPPEDVAQAWKRIIQEEVDKGSVVEHVVFAILRPITLFNPNLTNSNYEVFTTCFTKK